MDDTIYLDPSARLARLNAGVMGKLPSLPRDVAAEARQLVRDAGALEVLGTPQIEAQELVLRRFCYLHGLSDELAAAGSPHPYNFRRRFADNKRPAGTPPDRPMTSSTNWNVLGYDVGYPLGVPASPLTAKLAWIQYFARYGFNVFTFKTVRRRCRDELPFPNWVYLQNLDTPLQLGTDISAVVAKGNLDTYLSRSASYSTANSFGVPSADPDEWMDEVRSILAVLPPGSGKLLIVSVMGDEELVGDEFIEDFVEVAKLASQAGAPAIELNLSCPNKLDRQGGMMRPICETPDLTAEIVKAVRKNIDQAIPIVAKLSYLSYAELEVLLPLIGDEVQGVAGINTIQARVVDPASGEPTFQGENKDGKRVVRPAAGISGVALRHFALDFVNSLNRLRSLNDGWRFDILAMGGVMDAHDVRALMATGAACVQTATAAATNPALPLQMQEAGLTQGDDPGLLAIREALLADDGSLRPVHDVATRLDVDPSILDVLSDRPYDLPRFVAELVAMLRRGDNGSQRPSEPTGDSHDTRAAMQRATALRDALKRAQHERLLAGSLGIDEAAERMGMQPDDVRGLVEAGELLAVGEGDATRVPIWQLTDVTPSRPIEGVATLARSFPGPPEVFASWVTTSHPQLSGRTPLAALREGEQEVVFAVSGAIAAAGR